MKSRLSDVVIPDCTIPDLVLGDLQGRADHVALVDALSGRAYTFKELKSLTQHTASGLTRLGVQKGDVVALISQNSPEFVIIFFAVLEIGAIVTTVNPSYQAYEIGTQLKDSGASYVYTTSTILNQVRAAVENIATVRETISLGGGSGCVSFSRLLEDDGSALPHHVPHDTHNDTALIFYSSGTTGLPKGVCITHRNLVANVMQQEHPEMLTPPNITQSGMEIPHVMMCCLPFFHAYAVILCLTKGLHLGYKLVIPPGFKPETFLNAIQEYKVTIVPAVPPMVLFMVKSPLVEKYNLRSIRYIHCSAAPLDSTTDCIFKKMYPLINLSQCYGMTEGCLMLFTAAAVHKQGIVGETLPNTEAKVVDGETGTVLGMRQRGELMIRSPTIMKGYLNRPEATHRTVNSQGWLHTGDVAYYDEDGHFYVVDRIKEIMKVKGFQVAPAELEAVLLTHPAVADVGVIGVPHTRSGEVPCAFIVRKPDHLHVTGEDIQAFVKEKVTQYKWLAGGVQFLAEIPKSPTGKILRRKLRELSLKSKSKL